MIRNILTIVWNQRRTNLLIALEITISFLVLLFVMIQILNNLFNYLEPLGFDYANVWHISIGGKGNQWQQEEEQVYNALREVPEIVSIGTTFPFPYAAGWSANYSCNGASFEAVNCLAGSDLMPVLGIRILNGRWFSDSDAANQMIAVVVNNVFVRRAFGDANPIGKVFTLADTKVRVEFRIIGVVENFKINGEFSTNNPFVFMFMKQKPVPRPVGNFIIRVIPRATAALEEKIVQKIQPISKKVSARIDRLEDMRKSYLQSEVAPLFAGGAIAFFMLLMVILGLSGVLWLNVSRRIKEIGLRRAKGATKNNIYNQITGELFCIAMFALLVGNLIAIQFLLFDFMAFISREIYIISIVISSGIILFISYVCSIYPSYLAARIHPAEALHAE
ncbi:MAG: ABC transporter permease [Patescibacteria group bacterium]|nr:ABC transporter permease [Patescibacteria group bacterium]